VRSGHLRAGLVVLGDLDQADTLVTRQLAAGARTLVRVSWYARLVQGQGGQCGQQDHQKYNSHVLHGLDSGFSFSASFTAQPVASTKKSAATNSFRVIREIRSKLSVKRGFLSRHNRT